jgi:peroxiredoxin
MIKKIVFVFTLIALNSSTNLMAQVPINAEDISPLLIGESLPKANLLDVEGKDVLLQDVLKVKPTVLVFYRGGWCPYCNDQLSSLAESEKEILELGFQIVAISPDHFESLKPTVDKGELDYNIYSDSGAKLIQDIGIGFETPEKAKGYIFKKTNKDATDVLPVPAVFIIDTKGKILFEYINPDYSTRLSSELLLASLKALKAKL